MLNETMWAPCNPASWQQGSSIDPNTYGVSSPGIVGYCTITNTIKGKSKSIKVWVGSEAYKRIYNEAPKETVLS